MAEQPPAQQQYQQQPPVQQVVVQPQQQQYQQQPVQVMQQPNQVTGQQQPVQYVYVQQPNQVQMQPVQQTTQQMQQQPVQYVVVNQPVGTPMQLIESQPQVWIKQPVRAKEFITEQFLGWNMQNYYELMVGDLKNPPILKLEEESNCCLRQCLKTARPFILNARNMNDTVDAAPLFMIERPYRCGYCCCSPLNVCGMSYMEVFIGNNSIGSIREEFMCCGYVYGVWTADEQLICKVSRRGCFKACMCVCPGNDIEFEIEINGVETGKKISKLWAGILKEAFTDKDNFRVDFPTELATKENKILLIAAAMMIEYRHFEQPKSNNN